MNNIANKLHQRQLRKNRIRAIVSGTESRPRLSVYISNRNVTAQIIDDSNQKTLVYVTTVGAKSTGDTMVKRAEWTGQEIAKKAKSAKVTKVVLDRNGKRYHGRIKALAEKARESGLEF